MVKKISQLLLDPLPGQSEFLERVVVVAVKAALRGGRLTQFLTKGFAHRPTEVGIDFFQRRSRVFGELAIIDAIVLVRRHFLAELEQMLKPADRQQGVSFCFRTVRLHPGRMRAPDPPKHAHM